VEAQYSKDDIDVSGQAATHARLYTLCSHPTQNPLAFVFFPLPMFQWASPLWSRPQYEALDGYDTMGWTKNQGTDFTGFIWLTDVPSVL
jgi:hypothetical protein